MRLAFSEMVSRRGGKTKFVMSSLRSGFTPMEIKERAERMGFSVSFPLIYNIRAGKAGFGVMKQSGKSSQPSVFHGTGAKKIRLLKFLPKTFSACEKAIEEVQALCSSEVARLLNKRERLRKKERREIEIKLAELRQKKISLYA